MSTTVMATRLPIWGWTDICERQPPSVFLSLLRGRAESTDSRVNFRTIRYPSPLLAFLLLLSFLPSYTYLIYRRSRICSTRKLFVFLEFTNGMEQQSQSACVGTATPRTWREQRSPGTVCNKKAPYITSFCLELISILHNRIVALR